MHTAADAAMRNYKIIVYKECVGSASKEANDWAIKHMENILLEVQVK
jgi:nicotinamidase-related amidase